MDLVLRHIATSKTTPKVKKREYSWGTKTLPPYSQMSRYVIALFGGQATFIRALRAAGSSLCRSSVQRWKQRHPRGTHGRIPMSSWLDVIYAAHRCGIAMDPKTLAELGGGLRYFHTNRRRRPSGKKGVKWPIN
jgi:hypothetical protein